MHTNRLTNIVTADHFVILSSTTSLLCDIEPWCGLTLESNKAPRSHLLTHPPPVGWGKENQKGNSEKTHGLRQKQFNR